MTSEVESPSPATIQPRYWAFLSYSHQDERHAAWLHRALETYRLPRDLVGRVSCGESVPPRLTPIFRDRDDLSGAANLSDTIRKALRESRTLVVICSPKAVASRWVDEEVRYFKSLGRADRIFCLIASGQPNVSHQPQLAHEECFPPSIRFELTPQGATTEQPAEPLAADARPEGDGRENALLKLVAGILGLRLDELRRREQVRQRRRRLALTAASLTAMAVLASFSLFSLMMWQHAEQARVIAEGAELSERAAKVRAISEKNRAEKLTNHALDYVSTIGGWFTDTMGTSPETLDFYQEFLLFNNDEVEKLTSAAPESGRARQLKAVFLIFSAQAHARALSNETSEKAIARQEIAAAQTLLKTVRSHPEDPLWEARTALLYTNLSMAQLLLQETLQATDSAQRAVEIVDQINFDRIPASRGLAARVYENYGEMQAMDKQTDASLQSLRKAETILKQVLRESGSEFADPRQLDMFNLLISIAHIELERNRPAVARTELEKAREFLPAVKTREGYGAAWTLRLYWSECAEVYSRIPDVARTRLALDGMLETSERLVALPNYQLPKEYREDQWKLKRLMVEALDKRAALEQNDKMPDRAISYLQRAAALCRGMAINHSREEYHEDYLLRIFRLADLYGTLNQWDDVHRVAAELKAYCDGLSDQHPDAGRRFFFQALGLSLLARADWERENVQLADEQAAAALELLASPRATDAPASIKSQIAPVRSRLFTLLTATRLAKKKLTEATEAVLQAVNLDIKNSEAVRWKAHALLLTGKGEEAKKFYLTQWATSFFSAEYSRQISHDFEHLRHAGAVSPEVESEMQEIEMQMLVRKK